MFVLPGDAWDENDNPMGVRIVNANDQRRIRDLQNGVIVQGYGALGYDLRSDLDGNGFIDAVDQLLVRDRQNSIIYPLSQSPANNERVLKGMTRRPAINLAIGGTAGTFDDDDAVADRGVSRSKKLVADLI